LTLDILFLAKNRQEFTRESLAALGANTNWELVRKYYIWDDGSVDGTQAVIRAEGLGYPTSTSYGSPAAAMSAFVAMPDPPDAFAKIDNDVIVPPGWLDACVAVMEAHPELDLLGIEPPASRTPHYEGGPRSKCPELDVEQKYRPGMSPAETPRYQDYAPCDSIGGIGLMRTKAFLENEPLKPHSTYGGFTEFQLQHPRITKGWIVPPLKVFLLDRMPTEPWMSLGREYERKGWQRAWSKYPMAARDELWGWWKPVAETVHA
jgi:hypothetical protein